MQFRFRLNQNTEEDGKSSWGAVSLPFHINQNALKKLSFANRVANNLKANPKKTSIETESEMIINGRNLDKPFLIVQNLKKSKDLRIEFLASKSSKPISSLEPFVISPTMEVKITLNKTSWFLKDLAVLSEFEFQSWLQLNFRVFYSDPDNTFLLQDQESSKKYPNLFLFTQKRMPRRSSLSSYRKYPNEQLLKTIKHKIPNIQDNLERYC